MTIHAGDDEEPKQGSGHGDGEEKIASGIFVGQNQPDLTYFTWKKRNTKVLNLSN